MARKNNDPERMESSTPDPEAESSQVTDSSIDSDSGPDLAPDADPGPGPERDHQVLLFLQLAGGQINRASVQRVIEQLGGYSASRRPNSRIDVWLDSPGGDAHAAYKLGLFLREAFEEVVFVIVDYAKSAATLLSLAGDRIYMAPAAELGPLDTQENREGEVKFRSYLETADAIDNLYGMAVMNAIAGGGMVLQHTALTREATIQNMMKFAADFSRPLLEQIDPTAVIAANTSLNVAAEYGSRLLSYRNNRDGIEQARMQTDMLIRGYPTHGYVIDRDEAKTVLDLPVEHLEDYEYILEVEALYSAAQQQGQNLIGVHEMSEIQRQVRGGVIGDENSEDDDATRDELQGAGTDSAPRTGDGNETQEP